MKTLYHRNKFERFERIFTLLGEGDRRVTVMNSESENEVGLFHSLVDPLGPADSFVFSHSFCDRALPRLPRREKRRRRGLIGGWCVRSADDDIETLTRSTDIGGQSTIVFVVHLVVVVQTRH